MQKENNEIKIELDKYQNYFQNISRKSYQKPLYTKPLRKRKHYYYDELEQSGESDSYVTEIRRRPKKQIDGISEYEPDSPIEEGQEEDNNYDIQSKHRGKQPNQKEKPEKKLKKVLQNQ